MTDGEQRNTKPYPDGWLAVLVEDVDFERAYTLLRGYDHFHSETLRGKIRSFQLRVDEAREHFAIAEKLFESFEPTRTNLLYSFFLRFYSAENEVLAEAREPCEASSSRTDEEIARFLELEELEFPVTSQLRQTALAFDALRHADYESSLDLFESLIEESSSRFEDQQVTFCTGAAAAAHEMGAHDKAWRHYQSAALGVNALSQPLKTGLSAAKLYTLLQHWGRTREAEEWLAVLKHLRCPQASRDTMIKKAKLFHSATVTYGRLFIY